MTAETRIAALRGAGNLAAIEGDYERATALHDNALHLARQQSSAEILAGVLHSGSVVWRQRGEYQRATELGQESLGLMRTLEHRGGIAQASGNLGVLALLRGEVDAAEACLNEGLGLWQTLHIAGGIADALCNLAWVAEQHGQYRHAASLGQQSLVHYWRLGNRLGVAEALERLADVAVSARLHQRAARLLGMATAVRERIGAPRPPTTERFIEAATVTVRAALGDAAFGMAWGAGQQLAFDQAIADALAWEGARESAPASLRARSLPDRPRRRGRRGGARLRM